MLWNSNNSASRSKPGRTRRKTLQESKLVRIGNLIKNTSLPALPSMWATESWMPFYRYRTCPEGSARILPTSVDAGECGQVEQACEGP